MNGKSVEDAKKTMLDRALLNAIEKLSKNGKFISRVIKKKQ